jgi:flagellar basal body rod protein FlgC
MEIKSHETVLETLLHIYKVQKLLSICMNKICERLIVHDKSKIFSDELEGFTKLSKDIKEIEFGSSEYVEQLSKLNDTLEHHYKENRHHPEHFKNGIVDMNLIDVLEMTVDWMASAERSKEGNVMRSLPFQKQRFVIDDQLYQIIRNTILYLDGK